MNNSSKLTARELAAYILAKHGRQSLVKLSCLMYFVLRETLCEDGWLLFDEPVYRAKVGVRIDTITADWLRRRNVGRTRQRRHLKALERRVRTWSIQEAARSRRRHGTLNIPGGWGSEDRTAQYAGLAKARAILGRKP